MPDVNICTDMASLTKGNHCLHVVRQVLLELLAHDAVCDTAASLRNPQL